MLISTDLNGECCVELMDYESAKDYCLKAIELQKDVEENETCK